MDTTIKIAITALALVFVAGIAVVFFGIPVQQDSHLNDDGGVPTDAIYFFYGTECPHCHDIMPFIENMKKKYPDAHIQVLEVWHNETNEQLYIQANAAAGVTRYGVPEVVAGKTALSGTIEIPAKFEGVIQDYLDRKSKSGIQPVDTSLPGTTIRATYFYGDGCEHCEKVKPLIEALQQKYPELNLEKLELWSNQTNQQRYVEVCQQYALGTPPGIPVIFIGDQALVGEPAIKNRLEERILAEKERIVSGNTTMVKTVPVTNGTTVANSLTPPMVIVPALVDSFNPCALSVLIFLLISIAAAANRRRILLIGGSYTAAVFLFHILLGIGIFSVVSFSGISKIFSLAGAAVALLLGIITLADVARNRDNFILSVPTSGKGLMARYIRLASVPAAFILGVLAGLLGFSCTGGIYISILALMGTSLSLTAGLPYLLLYNIVFVLPLVLVTLLVAYGLSPERAETWRSEHKRGLRLAIGMIMVVLGIVIFLGWFG
jgi:cytochrome c biogenesis protein CcdA/thiol-disulfide isomerase/thioredoxin